MILKQGDTIKKVTQISVKRTQRSFATIYNPVPADQNGTGIIKNQVLFYFNKYKFLSIVYLFRKYCQAKR